MDCDARGRSDPMGGISGCPATKAANAPAGKLITAKNQWVQVVFDPLRDPSVGFTGNGLLESTTGKLVLECLAITSIDSTAVIPYAF